MLVNGPRVWLNQTWEKFHYYSGTACIAKEFHYYLIHHTMLRNFFFFQFRLRNSTTIILYNNKWEKVSAIKSWQDFSSFKTAHIFSSAIRSLFIKRFKDKIETKASCWFSCRLSKFSHQLMLFAICWSSFLKIIFLGTRTLQRAFIVSPHRKKDSMERVRYGLKECSQVGIDQGTICHIKLEKSSIINQA